MSVLSITSSAPSERRLTGGVLFLLAGLAALGALATNIILPAFSRIGASLGVSPQELGLTLSSFFVAFAFGQLLVGPLSDRFGRKWLVLGGACSLCRRQCPLLFRRHLVLPGPRPRHPGARGLRRLGSVARHRTHVDAHAVTATLNAALEDIADVQLAADRLRVERLPFVSKRRIARNHDRASHA